MDKFKRIIIYIVVTSFFVYVLLCVYYFYIFNLIISNDKSSVNVNDYSFYDPVNNPNYFLKCDETKFDIIDKQNISIFESGKEKKDFTYKSFMHNCFTFKNIFKSSYINELTCIENLDIILHSKLNDINYLDLSTAPKFYSLNSKRLLLNNLLDINESTKIINRIDRIEFYNDYEVRILTEEGFYFLIYNKGIELLEILNSTQIINCIPEDSYEEQRVYILNL